MAKQDTSNTAQAMWIGIGSLFSFLFTIVSAAILSRYMTKDEYGTYKQVMYVYSTLLTVFTLGLPLAYSYFLPRVSLGEGKNLTNKLNGVFFALGTVFSIVLFLGSDIIAEILKNENLGRNIRVFSPAPIFMLPTMGLQGILATYKRTIWNAIYTVLTRILMLLFVALPVAWYKADSETAIWGFNISSAISLIIALWIKNIPFRGVKSEQSKISYKEIFSYSIPLMTAGLFGVAAKAADQFFVSRYFGQEVFADFANGSLELPFVSMVLSASATVLLPAFSRMISEGESKENIIALWKRTAVKSVLIIYPLVTFFWFFAGDTMIFLYGDKYASSAIFFRIMLCVNLFTVIPFYPIILAMGKTKDYARIHMINFVMVWALEFFAVKTLNSAYAITAVSVVCYVVKIIMMTGVISSAINVSMLKLFPIKDIETVLLSCAVAGLTTRFVISLIPLAQIKIFVLAAGFALFSLLIYLLSIPLKIDYLNVVRPLLNKLSKRKER